MANHFKMKPSEIFLTITVVCAVAGSIIMALCIGLVLQHHCDCSNKITLGNHSRSLRLDAKSVPFTKVQPLLPYVVSISAATYADSNLKKFICNGLIFSDTWVLTGEACVTGENDLSELELRAGSTIWDFEGSTRSVARIIRSHLRNLVALRATPPFVLQKTTMPVKIQSANATWTCAVLCGWSNQPEPHTEYAVETWTTINNCRNVNQCRKGVVVIASSYDCDVTGRGLLDRNGRLIALECALPDYAKKVFFTVDNNRSLIEPRNATTDDQYSFQVNRAYDIFKTDEC